MVYILRSSSGPTLICVWTFETVEVCALSFAGELEGFNQIYS